MLFNGNRFRHTAFSVQGCRMVKSISKSMLYGKIGFH